MKIKRFLPIFPAFILVSWLASTASAETGTSFQTGCPFQVGDSKDKVKRFYGIDYEPTRRSRSYSASVYEYRFPAHGVWIFLDVNEKVHVLRFDRPFAGRIGGVAIGDTKDKVRSIKGEPQRESRGVGDGELLSQLEKRKQKILTNLPDPSPKSEVISAFNEITRLEQSAVSNLFTTAWSYKADTHLRYDFGSLSNQVQTIFAGSCNPK